MSLDSYRGERVAVVGAAGFIGRWVARLLTERGARLALVVRDPQAAVKVFARYRIEGEVWDRPALDQIRPSFTFNLAGYGVDRSQTDETTAYEVNARLVETLCRGWPEQVLVHAGSGAELHPVTAYGRSKLEGSQALERLAKQLPLKAVTARLFTVYGPGERSGRLLPALMEAARMGDPVSLTAGTQRRDFTYVEDAAEALLRLGLAGAGFGEAVNVASGRLVSVREFAETAARLLGMSPEQLRFGEIPTRPEEFEYPAVAVERLLSLAGWIPPTDIAEGIAKTIAFHAD